MPGINPTPMKRQCPELSTAMFVNPMNALNPLAAVQPACNPMLRPQATLMPFPGAISKSKFVNV